MVAYNCYCLSNFLDLFINKKKKNSDNNNNFLISSEFYKNGRSAPKHTGSIQMDTKLKKPLQNQPTKPKD
jgi:hypothetical protein